MSHKSSEKFWLENPCILITNFCKFNPFVAFTDKRFSNNMNAYTRLIIILMIVIFTITKEINYILIGIFLIIIIIIMYYSFRKDSFKVLPSSFPFIKSNDETIGERGTYLLKNAKLPRRESNYNNIEVPINNPLKNVPLTDYGVEQEYSKATRSDSTMSQFANGKIFQTSDQWIFDRNTQPFYTTANSSVPNDQTSFANWLYGTENICKEGSIYAHRTGTPQQTLNCNGFNVATPTNFGNLNDYVAPSN
jgi:hypothetical protein